MPLVLAQVDWDDLTDPSADTAVTTHHYQVPIFPPGPADADAFEAAFSDFFTAIQAIISTDVRVTRIRFYAVSEIPGEPMGQPFEDRVYAQTGTSTAARMPPQVSLAVTEKTFIRRRWGRFYLPGLTTIALGTNGRPDNGVVSTIAGAAEAMYLAMRTSGREFAVHRRIDATFVLVTDVQSDNVFDIIRRRRHSLTTFRDSRPVDV